MYKIELKELGLTDNQSEIYLLLLKNGAMSSSEISKKLGFHRGYIYDTLERMQEKEVANSYTENNKKYFQATRPDDLLNILRLKLDNFEKITPNLMQFCEAEEDLKVEVYKGKKAFRTLISDMISNLNDGDEVLFTGIDEKMLIEEIEPFYFRKFLNMMENQKVKERVIVKKGSKKIKLSNMFHKEVDEKYLGNTMEVIYKNKIGFFTSGITNKLVLIENHEFAQTYKNKFELLWEIAR